MRMVGLTGKPAFVALAASLAACDPDSGRVAENARGGAVTTTISSEPVGKDGAAGASGLGLQPPWRLTRKVATATIFVDLSASMRGFVRDKGGPLYEMMSRLKDFLIREGISGLDGSGFGTTVREPQPLPGPSELISVAADERNTCLARPLEYAAARTGASERALIVVSDSVASAAGGACGSACADGTDVACVATSLTDLAKRGLGIWLVGFRMPFDGHYYPELGAAPFRAPQGTVRPIYLWILAPDLELGRNLTTSLATWGRAALGAGDTLAAEVWPGRWLGYRVADQPDSGWQLSHFSAHDYAQKVGVLSTDIKSIHRKTCFDKSSRDWLDTPFLCLEHTRGRLTWVGQVPMMPADRTIEAADAVVPIMTATSALQLAPNQVGPGTDQDGASPPVPIACLSPAGDPVTGEEVRVTNASWIKGCLEPYRGSPNGDRYRLLAALELGGQLNEARVEVEWAIAPQLDALTAWNTEDDSKPTTLGQTLGLTRLWGLVTDLLAHEPKLTPLIELGWPGGS